MCGVKWYCLVLSKSEAERGDSRSAPFVSHVLWVCVRECATDNECGVEAYTFNDNLCTFQIF